MKVGWRQFSPRFPWEGAVSAFSLACGATVPRGPKVAILLEVRERHAA